MTACVVCLRPVEDSCPTDELCRECQASHDSDCDPLDGEVAWAAKRARKFAYEDAAKSLEMMAGGFHLDAKATKWEERCANERAEQVLREAAAAIRTKAGK